MSLIDTIVGNIRLTDVIGKGGYANVYKGVHCLNDCVVAIKILDPSKYDKQNQMEEEFFNELQSAAGLDHPRITRVLDYGEVNLQSNNGSEVSQHWLAMELVEGGTVKDLKGRLQWNQLKQIIIDILDGLAHAHARRLIHRDIKPRNILYDVKTERIKIADFGLGRSVNFERDSAIVEEQYILGTPQYMAPEQILCETLSFGPWTDLYAVGCMVWELITGQVPYTGQVRNVLRQHLQGSLPKFKPTFDVPQHVEQWLGKLLKRSPNERFQHAAQAKYSLLHLNKESNTDTVQINGMELYLDDFETERFTHSFHDDVDLGTSTQIMTSQIQFPSSKIAGFVKDDMSLSFPEDWRKKKEASVKLRGLGSKLFELKTHTMVGREEVRTELWKSLQLVCTESSQQVFFLEGVDGVGKNTCAKWLAYRADELGLAQWICLDLNPNRNIKENIGELLGASLRIHKLNYAQAFERTAKIVQKLNMNVDSDPQKLLQLVKTIDESGGEETDVFMDLAECINLVLRYLCALSAVRPLVLILRDIHLEPAILQFIERLVGIGQDVPIMVLATLSTNRSDENVHKFIEDRLNQPNISKSILPLLSKVELTQFIQSLLSLTSDEASRIEEICRGKPKVAVQIISEWIERGVLVPSPDGYKLKDDSEVYIPDSILEIWSDRYKQLCTDWSDKDRSAFEVGAVLGQTVLVDEWYKAAKKLGVRPCVALMRELQKKHWIHIESETGTWKFIDPLFRDAVLEHLENIQLRSKYSQIVLSILPSKHEEIPRRALLSYHAGDAQKSLVLLGDACIRNIFAMELGQAKRFRRLRNTILDVTTVGHKSKHNLVTELIEIFLMPQQQKNSCLLKRGEEFLDWAREIKDWDKLIILHKMIGIQAWKNGEVEKAKESLLNAVRIAKRVRSIHQITILHRLAFITTEVDQSIQYAREALTQSEKIGDFAQIGSSYVNLSWAYQRKGDLNYAVFFLDEARHRFIHSNSRSGLITVYDRMGEIYRKMGRFSKAEQSFLRALETNQIYGEISYEALITTVNLIVCRYQMGLFKESSIYIDRIWRLVFPELHPKLPKITLICVSLCMAPYQAWNQDWKGLSENLLRLRGHLEQIHFYDEDVYLLLNMCLHRCNDANQHKIVQLIWNIQHEQYLREGRTGEAKSIESFMQSQL